MRPTGGADAFPRTGGIPSPLGGAGEAIKPKGTRYIDREKALKPDQIYNAHCTGVYTLRVVVNEIKNKIE